MKLSSVLQGVELSPDQADKGASDVDTELPALFLSANPEATAAAVPGNPDQADKGASDVDTALPAPFLSANPETAAAAVPGSPVIDTPGAPLHRVSRRGPRAVLPSLEQMKHVLHILLNCEEKEKAVLGVHASLLSRRTAGSAISEEDLDVISMFQHLSLESMPVVGFLMEAHGAFTPAGMLSLKKTLEVKQLI